MAKVLFLHGLNTYGDDQLHVGPLRFGSMHAHVVRGLRGRGVAIQAVTDLGAGSPTELAERAIAQLRPIADSEIYLLGHSVGGLVARALAAHPEMQNRVRAILTFGTPHFGAIPAEFALASAENRPLFNSLARRVGYDTKAKAEVFTHFTKTRLQIFNERHAPIRGVEEISLICDIPKSQLSWPLRLSYRYFHPERESSDGFITVASQSRGRCEGPFRLDHFGELGYFFAISRRHRREAANEFKRLLDTIAAAVPR